MDAVEELTPCWMLSCPSSPFGSFSKMQRSLEGSTRDYFRCGVWVRKRDILQVDSGLDFTQ